MVDDSKSILLKMIEIHMEILVETISQIKNKKNQSVHSRDDPQGNYSQFTPNGTAEAWAVAGDGLEFVQQ